MYSIIPFTYTHKRMHTQYAVVIDAGSSHTDMYFYRWTVPRDKFTGEIHEIDSCKTSSELCLYGTASVNFVECRDCYNIIYVYMRCEIWAQPAALSW